MLGDRQKVEEGDQLVAKYLWLGQMLIQLKMHICRRKTKTTFIYLFLKKNNKCIFTLKNASIIGYGHKKWPQG